MVLCLCCHVKVFFSRLPRLKTVCAAALPYNTYESAGRKQRRKNSRSYHVREALPLSTTRRIVVEVL
ncbi:hypothetical protein I7I50_09488 [Histoplasma capsulatum G186AR]|uniref:Uncharacterized protein n=1 Tax=Ajellomyces capsulatus TaxID=5037 RepID=A0A8H7YRH3_AJECA|nr:hypothetical protein I7I52_07009 [Histoplasma capsulatum]QSS74360.1 hypothetical protein I7I50_09488 [Histoplasma capsulatum G186AR]